MTDGRSDVGVGRHRAAAAGFLAPTRPATRPGKASKTSAGASARCCADAQLGISLDAGPGAESAATPGSPASEVRHTLSAASSTSSLSSSSSATTASSLSSSCLARSTHRFAGDEESAEGEDGYQDEEADEDGEYYGSAGDQDTLDAAFAQLAIDGGLAQLEQPASLALGGDENRVLRIPGRALHEAKARELNAMLCGIRGDPRAFVREIEARRQRDCGGGSDQEPSGPPEAEPPASPSRLAAFKVHSVLGRGSFSTVYVATRRSDGIQFALKRVRLTGLESTQSRAKSVKEIRVLQSLEHPNIIKCFEHFHAREGLFIVLEWAVAGDLKRMLKRVQAKQSRFHERVIWNYFAQVACALAYMHERRMIHRDIKPANVFIMPDGRIKLGDLGLSRALSQATVRAYSKVGTPLYMAPEVLQGAGHDFKSDVWSLGCLLYELAMLHSPFEVGCKTMKTLFTRILHAAYFPLSNTYSDSFSRIIASIFMVDPEQRPSAAEVHRAAEDCVRYYEARQDLPEDDVDADEAAHIGSDARDHHIGSALKRTMAHDRRRAFGDGMASRTF